MVWKPHAKRHMIKVTKINSYNQVYDRPEKYFWNV